MLIINIKYLRTLSMLQMIKKGSTDWMLFLRDLQVSIEKSNRDILCLACWEIIKYDRNIKHKAENPDHLSAILTSRDYGSEWQIINLAKENGKLIIEGEDLYIENPYKRFEKRGRRSRHPLLWESLERCNVQKLLTESPETLKNLGPTKCRPPQIYIEDT